MQRLLLVLALTLAVLPDARPADAPKPLERAHAHNDYEHPHPLLDALGHGFCSVEADVHLVNGQLLVAHDAVKVAPDRTLEKLYLDPLLDRTRRHGGRVFPKGPTLTLLIDFKTAAEPTYAALKPVLERYAAMFTVFHSNRTELGAVSVVISGNRPIVQMAAEARRLSGCDARIADLVSKPSVHLFPLVSESWNTMFQWRGTGPLGDADRAKLQELVTRAHTDGRRIRFWAMPDHEAGWRLAYEAGIDLINTDNLGALAGFLAERAK